jgi:protein-S-isoprenylcysteine O-methyltransferase Ste14
MENQNDKAWFMPSPPILFIGAIIVGVVLNFLIPIEIILLSVRLFVGAPLFICFVIIASLTFRAFIKHGTGFDHKKPTVLIITSGPFRITRNPLYLSGIFLMLGAGLILNNIWVLGLTVPVVIALIYGMVIPEEKFLTEKFGKEYLRYKSSVRRWI